MSEMAAKYFFFILLLILCCTCISAGRSKNRRVQKTKTSLPNCKTTKSNCAKSNSTGGKRNYYCHCKSSEKCSFHKKVHKIYNFKVYRCKTKCKLSKSQPLLNKLADKVIKVLEWKSWKESLEKSVKYACQCKKSTKRKRSKKRKRTRSNKRKATRCEKQSRHCTSYIANNFKCFLSNSQKKKCSYATNLQKLMDIGVLKRIRDCERKNKNCQGIRCTILGLFEKCMDTNFKPKYCPIRNIFKNDIKEIGKIGDVISALAYHVTKMYKKFDTYGVYASDKCFQHDGSSESSELKDLKEKKHRIEFHFKNKLEDRRVHLQLEHNTDFLYGHFREDGVEKNVTIEPRSRSDVQLEEDRKCYHEHWSVSNMYYRSFGFYIHVEGNPKCTMKVEYRTLYYRSGKSYRASTVCTMEGAKTNSSYCDVEVHSHVMSGCSPSTSSDYYKKKTLVVVIIKVDDDSPVPASSISGLNKASNDKETSTCLTIHNNDDKWKIEVDHEDDKNFDKGSKLHKNVQIEKHSDYSYNDMKSKKDDDTCRIMFFIHNETRNSDNMWVFITIQNYGKSTNGAYNGLRVCRITSALSSSNPANEHNQLRAMSSVRYCDFEQVDAYDIYSDVYPFTMHPDSRDRD